MHLDEANPYVLFRESTTKDNDKRAVPLRPEIVAELKALKPKPDEVRLLQHPVFWFRWPTYDIRHGDFKRAGIERFDLLGGVVHFHSFRKTWQTLGVRYGINQRVAQEVLGYSDANLTANVYTDVPALAPHAEIAKLPWIDAQPGAKLVGDEITKQARNWLGERLDASKRRHIIFMDRPELLDLAVSFRFRRCSLRPPMRIHRFDRNVHDTSPL